MREPVQTVIAAAHEFLGERTTTNATLREHKLVFTILFAVIEAERERSGRGLGIQGHRSGCA